MTFSTSTESLGLPFTDLRVLLNVIMEELFAPDQRRIVSNVDKMIEEHGRDVLGLAYLDTKWSHSRVGKGQRVAFKPVDPSQYDRASQIHQDITKVRKDFVTVRQTMVSLFGGVQDIRIIRDVLPENIVELVFKPEDLAKLPRTNEPGYTLSKRDKVYFDETLKTIDVYLAARYFF